MEKIKIQDLNFNLKKEENIIFYKFVAGIEKIFTTDVGNEASMTCMGEL